jgi:hypothetical protein
MLEPVMTMNEGARIYSPGRRCSAEASSTRSCVSAGSLTRTGRGGLEDDREELLA